VNSAMTRDILRCHATIPVGSIRKLKPAAAAIFVFHLHEGARQGAPQATQIADR
jgi:hypothetical protein